MEPTTEQVLGLLVQLAMGVSLAACAGLRAFLPLLVVGLAGRMEAIPLSDSFEWLASTPALMVFAAAVVVEVLGDKVPAVDNFLDLVQVWIKPVAGTILVASVLTELGPLTRVVLGIVLGGSAAEAVHVLKAKLRLVSTVSTAGFGNPVISTVEDAGSLLGSIGALILPVLVFLIVIILLGFSLSAVRRILRSTRSVHPHPRGQQP